MCKVLICLVKIDAGMIDSVYKSYSLAPHYTATNYICRVQFYGEGALRFLSFTISIRKFRDLLEAECRHFTTGIFQFIQVSRKLRFP